MCVNNGVSKLLPLLSQCRRTRELSYLLVSKDYSVFFLPLSRLWGSSGGPTCYEGPKVSSANSSVPVPTLFISTGSSGTSSCS